MTAPNNPDQHILIVDDNPSNIQVLGNTLRMNDLKFEFALSGQSALSWMSKKSFQLVLLDVMMPEMDGFETLRKIRANKEWDEVAVIFLTAKTDQETMLKGFDEGIQDYVTKPFNANELISRVKAHLARCAHENLLKSFNERLSEQVELRTEELKASESALKDTNQSLGNLIANIPSVVFKCKANDELEMLYLSPQFGELTGYNHLDFLGKSAKPILDLIPNSDRQSLGETIPSNRETGFKTKARIVHANGDLLWVSIQGNARKPAQSDDYLIEGVIHDITRQMALEELLMTHSTQAADKERDMIARELHDGIQQYLTSISISLQGIPAEAVEEEFRQRFTHGLDRLHQVTREIRSISHRLVPKSVEDLGLGPTLRELGTRQWDYPGVGVIVEENVDNRRYAPEVEINLFRITQEALNNALKYSQATEIRIQLFGNKDLLTLMIEDDGEGFDQEDINYRKKGFGLLSMESRAISIGGFFEINSTPKRGTQILVEIPFTH